MRHWNAGKIGRLIPLLAGLMLLSPAAHATGALNTIQNVYQTAMHGWFSTLQGIANDLFYSLAAIDITWMALTWMLTRKTFDEIVPSVLKKVMTLGFFLALLTNAGTWVPDVIDSFVDAGQQAGTYQTLTPSTIMTDAIGASVGILTGTTPTAPGQPAPTPAQQSVWEKIVGTVKAATSPLGDIEDVLLRIIVAFVVFAALTYIAIELLVLLIESYVVIGAGVLFLGFGGSRWTTKFVDGYLNYMVSLGTKLFVLYLIVGALVFQVLPAINTMLSSLTSGFSPTTGLAAVGATVVMAMLAKTLPHHAGALLSGASSLSGGHGVDAVKSVGKAAVAVGAAAAAPAVLAAGAAGAAGGGAAAAGGAAGATGAAGGGVAASSASAGVAAPVAGGTTSGATWAAGTGSGSVASKGVAAPTGGGTTSGSPAAGGQTSSSSTTAPKATGGSPAAGSSGGSPGTSGGDQPVTQGSAGNSDTATGSGSNVGGRTSSSSTITTKAPDGSQTSVTTADSGGTTSGSPAAGGQTSSSSTTAPKATGGSPAAGSSGGSPGTSGGDQPVTQGPAGTQQDARTTAGNSGAGTGSGSNSGGNKGSKGVPAPSRVATLKKVGGHVGNALNHGMSGNAPSVGANHAGTKHLDD